MDRNGYIGRAPADSSVIVARQVFSPSGVTTDFTFTSGYTPGYLDLYLNGSRLVEGTDYTATDTSTISVLNGGADGGDVVEAVAYKAFNVATATVGISSAGTSIGSVNALNFVGAGNTFALRGSTIDISISGSGGGSGVASTITVADESSDTTCFPVFVTAATGDLNPKSGSNLTFNSSNGTLTATTFGGNLTGNVTGDVTGTATTATLANTATVATNAQGLTGTPNISVGTISASGSVSIAGTLTYEDVTNIDSVGIITARSDISIADKIIHTSNTGTAIRFPANDTFTVETAGGERLRVNSAGNVGIATASPDNQLHVFGATASAIKIETGDGGFNPIVIQENPDRTWHTGLRGDVSDSWVVRDATASSNRVVIDTSGRVGIGTDNPTGAEIDANAQLLHIKKNTTSGALLKLESSNTIAQLLAGNNQFIVRTHTDDPIAFHVNGGEKLRFASSGQIGIAGANYGSSGQVLTSKGSGSSVAWESVSVGLTTEAATVTNGQTTLLDLGSAQDHKLTCTGTVTISCTGGTQADSHTVRIINSGITTVGFSTYFLFPSGSTPSLPTADGAISLISFTVNRVGAAGTQLLAGASLNYS